MDLGLPRRRCHRWGRVGSGSSRPLRRETAAAETRRAEGEPSFSWLRPDVVMDVVRQVVEHLDLGALEHKCSFSESSFSFADKADALCLRCSDEMGFMEPSSRFRLISGDHLDVVLVLQLQPLSVLGQIQVQRVGQVQVDGGGEVGVARGSSRVVWKQLDSTTPDSLRMI